MQSRQDSGFSLIELLVAMTVTLIVTGAVFGLLTGGQNAFRREPALTDRQQNIRVALDMVMRDVQAAGAGMSPFFQTFTDGLDGGGPAGLSGNSDFLQIFANDGTCPDMRVRPPVNGVNVTSAEKVPSCFGEPSLVLIYYDNGTTKWGLAFNMHTADDTFNFPGGQNQHAGTTLQTALDVDPLNAPDPVNYGLLKMVRYEIATAAGDTMPSLWRSEMGGLDVSGDYQAAPNPAGSWVLVARGVEDLQVRYGTLSGAGGALAWSDSSGTVTAGNYTTIVQQVRVTLSARAEGAKLQGETTSALGSAVRGQLTSVGTPHAALIAMQGASPAPWR